MPTADEIKASQRQAWDQNSAGWERWDTVVMASIGAVGDEMVRALDVAEDEYHLEAAAGTGEPGLTIAALAPRGRVVLTDLSPEMLAVAGRRAAAKGITNVEFRECSADDLPFADGTFDSVGCRFGFMFFPSLAQAVGEFARVLKPGGRLCASVWAGPEHNPWTTIPLAAISTEIQLPIPSPDAPGMFRCAAPGAISSLYSAAGLRDVREWDVPTALVTESAEQYWTLCTEMTVPVIMALAQVDEAGQARIKAKVMEAASAYPSGSGSGLSLPGLARCIVGTK